VVDGGKEKSAQTIALAGNPNAGKTCIFNELTGSNRRVGNYPGVTVEKIEGYYRYNNQSINVVDLPGIYSLTSYSQEEVVARRFIIEESPAVIINVIDASNLERNLYLTIQLLEIGANVIVVLNMMDEVKQQHVQLDVEMIAKRLGCPVVETIGTRGVGIEKLKVAVVERCQRKKSDTEIVYVAELGKEVVRISEQVEKFDDIPYPSQFAAIKLLEKDTEVMARFSRLKDNQSLFAVVDKSINRLAKLYGYPPEVLIGDRRYGFASGLVRESTISKPLVDRISITEKIDSFVTNRALGIPLFLLTMYLIFWLTFTLGAPLMEWMERGFGNLSGFVDRSWSSGTLPLFKSLIINGVIGGVGGVLIFLPNIVLLFLGISFLEDTGYMARIAFIMDRIMHKIGLHGRSFIPLMIGFGCTVPAIMATRTIRSPKTRLTTIMILPLMSCGARLPIYLMIIPAFFPSTWQTPILWLMYLIGVVIAFFVARLLRNTLFKGEAEPFVMELPPYRMPTLKAVLLHMWEKSWMYIRKAGTLILGAAIIMWFLLTFPQKTEFDIDNEPSVGTQLSKQELANIHQLDALDYSMAGRIGHWIEPVIEPMGFDWKIGTSFIGAFAAKELFVAHMGIVYSIGKLEDDPEGMNTLRTVLRQKYSSLTGFCIMLFALIATPCVATIAITRKETGSWKWSIIQWGGLTLLAWITTTIVYQTGSFLL